MRTAKKFTKSQLEVLYEKKSSSEIAKIYKCTKQTVINYLKMFGIKLKPVGRAKK